MIDEKLKSLGIELSAPPKPAGAYLPVVISNNLAYVSGQIPMKDGKVIHEGKVNDENLEEARKSAKLCAINILAQLKSEIGDLDKISKIVKVSGFVNSESNFTQQPKVIDAASDLFFEIFGEKGQHARIAVGVSSLPLNSMTEIDAVVEIEKS
ncbi:MAG: RidA family protein [Thaumarchaeota archaeon]|nr:RidA family protein [Nitrososphaerota archaeon]GFN41073.1 MAG: protein TCP17 [Marine Group I thaumarchaeote]